MRKAYIAPDCECMTFTVDDLIAAGCNTTMVQAGGNYSNRPACTITSNMGDALISMEVCEAVLENYCYNTVAGNVIFSS